MAFAEEIGLDPVVSVGEGAAAIPSVRIAMYSPVNGTSCKPRATGLAGILGSQISFGATGIGVSLLVLAQQQVAHGAAHGPGLVPGFPQPAHHRQQPRGGLQTPVFHSGNVSGGIGGRDGRALRGARG